MRKIIFVVAVVITVILHFTYGVEDPEAQVIIMNEPLPAEAGDARQIQLEFDPDTIIPNEITLGAAEQVVWVITNTDKDEDHTFIDYEAGLTETVVVPGQTVRRLWTAPTTPGKYEPYCTIHPWIRMVLIVE